jgi:hypothetical protein
MTRMHLRAQPPAGLLAAIALALSIAAGPRELSGASPGQPIPAYSERLPDSYEFVWPSGARLPLYSEADVRSGVRRIPAGEFRDRIRPRAGLAVRLVLRALSERSSTPRPGRLWVVDFSLRAGDLEREWIPRSVALASPADLQQARGARARVRRTDPRQMDREASAWPDPGGGVVVANARRSPELAARVALAAANLRSYQERWEPGADFPYPRVVGFAAPDGSLMAPRFAEHFAPPPTALYDKPVFRNHRYTDAATGAVLLDGRSWEDDVAGRARLDALEQRIRSSPASVLAAEDPPHTRCGAETLVYRQLVVEEPGGALAALPGGASVTSGGRVVPTLVTAEEYPEAAPQFTVPRDLLDRTCRLAARLDPARYMRLIGELDGEEVADERLVGASGVRILERSTRFAGGQLALAADYIEAYYRRLGFAPRRQECVHEGRRYHNVIVDLPGRTGEWVLLADHYDAAVAQDTVEPAPGPMRGAPGADDDLSGTAAVMETGRVLAAARHGPDRPELLRGIRLLHLVGEEFPADCLGARVHVADVLARRERIHGLIVLDMIGHAGPGGRLADPVFQLNQGEGAAAGRLTGAALQAFAALRRARLVPPELRPVIRRRYERGSYLHQTDGIIFSDAGFPAMLLNEHINRFHNLDRAGYHDMADDRASICRPYATGLARLALATTLLLAAVP